MYLQGKHKIGAVLTSTGVTVSIERAHIMTQHHDKEQMHKIALKFGWSLEKGLMIPHKACLVRKAKQLAINKHGDNSKKAKRARRKIFSTVQQLRCHKIVVLQSLMKLTHCCGSVHWVQGVRVLWYQE